MSDVETEWTGMVVGIGASAGGVPALRTFFNALPEHCNCAFIVILHSQSEGQSQLSQLIRACTHLHVCEATDGVTPARNHVYVARSDRAVTLAQGRLRTQPHSRGATRPGIDTVDGFLESLAADLGKRAIAVVLSGTGSDGAAGAMRVKQNGGMVFVQDPATAEHDGMPLAAIGTGAVDHVLAVEQIAQEIVTCGSSDHIAPARSEQLLEATDALEAIFELLRDKADLDLRGYKVTPLVWRIKRRLQIRGLKEFAEYAALLQREPAETESLVRDIPIHVTQFFRDPQAWDTLETQVIDRLFHDRSPTDPVRVWSAACASGEEAYSVAMLLSQRARRTQPPIDFRVFATDASPHIVAQASRGIFPQRAMGEMTAERQALFFRSRGAEQQVRNALRQKLVFAPQHLIADPPFRNLDLVICRNLLIYLDTEAMRHVIYLLHSALRTGGYLFLGASESLPADGAGFETVSLTSRIFRKVGPIASSSRSFPTRVADQREVQAQEAFGALNFPHDAPGERNWSEELRISHEELDASREELQAVNEELRAANEQLNLRNDELSEMNAQLQGKIEELKTQSSVLSSGDIMTVFLDDQLRVRWFTTAVTLLFPLMPSDVGRRISDLSPKFSDPHFIQDVLDVMRTSTLSESEVRSSDGLWYARRILPFHGGADPRKGVAVTFADITARINAERALRDNEHRFRTFVMSGADIVYRMNPDWSEMWQLRGAGRIPDLPEPTSNWLDVYIHPEDRARILGAARAAIEQRSIFDTEYRVRHIDGSFVKTHSRAVPILDERGNIIEWLGTVSDVVAASD